MPMLALARILLAPLLLWQGRQVRRRVPKLPEASGARLGLIGSDHAGHAAPRLRLLIVGLAITPLARILKQPRLIRFRRTVGLFAFAYVLLHLTNYVVTDQWFDWAAIGKDILKRPFITVGMAAFVLLVPLAVTSTNWALRKLGPVRWRKLHRLTYLIVPLGVIHYLMLVKADHRPPVIYGAIVALLLGWRLWDGMRKRRASGA